MNHIRPCIICTKQLEPVDPNYENSGPSGAVVFTSRGNYGSALYDPMGSGDEWLEINICDDCLAVAAEFSRVAQGTAPRPVTPPPTYVDWDPGTLTEDL